MTKVCQTQEEADAVEEGFERIREINNGRSNKINFEDYVKTFFWSAKKHTRDNTRRGYERDLTPSHPRIW